jgi:hypothetical protein
VQTICAGLEKMTQAEAEPASIVKCPEAGLARKEAAFHRPPATLKIEVAVAVRNFSGFPAEKEGRNALPSGRLPVMSRSEPKCPLCGGWMPSGHRCPRKRSCIDCGRPGNVFVPDPDALALDEAAMLEQADTDPKRDKALCDQCFYARARRQEQRKLN